MNGQAGGPSYFVLKVPYIIKQRLLPRAATSFAGRTRRLLRPHDIEAAWQPIRLALSDILSLRNRGEEDSWAKEE